MEKQPSLAAANQGRLDKALDRKYRFSHGVDTFRAMIERGAFSHAEVIEVPRIKYDRRKFNRMDYKEQAEYSRRMEEKKTEYLLLYRDRDGVSVTVPKMVYEWFKTKEAA
jgi:hypothetical protein